MMYYAVPVLIILIIALYLFTTRDKADSNIEPDQAVSETSSLPAETSAEGNVPEQIESDEKPMFGEARETTIEPEKKASIREKPPQVQVKKPEETEEENKPAEEVIAQGTVMEEKALQTSEVKPEEITQDETIMVEEEPEPETISDEPEGPVLTLSATVNLRTYVRIIVDDDPPKEFIFKPGANPDWTAKRGFEVKVGNAGGIEFVFNGEDIGTIGDMGRVRTVSFPDDFKTNWKEEE